jgi:hypothetical protein
MTFEPVLYSQVYLCVRPFVTQFCIMPILNLLLHIVSLLALF